MKASKAQMRSISNQGAIIGLLSLIALEAGIDLEDIEMVIGGGSPIAPNRAPKQTAAEYALAHPESNEPKVSTSVEVSTETTADTDAEVTEAPGSEDAEQSEELPEIINTPSTTVDAVEENSGSEENYDSVIDQASA